MWRLWAKALGEKIGDTNTEADMFYLEPSSFYNFIITKYPNLLI